jgi:dissimilatory sulfite reductase related protein
MNTTLNVPALQTNEEGYLIHTGDWNEQWATDVARSYNITLTDKHWDVLRWLRQKQAEGTALTIRKVANSGLVDIKAFYQLFPGGPLKVSSKIAGIPKPVSCI